MSPNELRRRRRALVRQIREASTHADSRVALNDVRRLRAQLTRLDQEPITEPAQPAVQRVSQVISDRAAWAKVTVMVRAARPADYRKPVKDPADVSDLVRASARPYGWGRGQSQPGPSTKIW